MELFNDAVCALLPNCYQQQCKNELRHWLLGTTSRAMPPSFVTDAVGQHIKMSGIPFGVKLVLY